MRRKKTGEADDTREKVKQRNDGLKKKNGVPSHAPLLPGRGTLCRKKYEW